MRHRQRDFRPRVGSLKLQHELTVLPLQLRDALADEDRATELADHGPLLIVLGPEISGSALLRLADRLGGHLVTGHVDGVGEVLRFAPVGESHELVIRAPQALAKYIARKGSATVNGVSLTVNRVDGADFSINLIPHTLAVTTLKHLAAGARVNLEIDLIARYVERMMTAEA